jgi:AraC-like DNA-binding protein/DNA gyrase inhibitor GyrI
MTHIHRNNQFIKAAQWIYTHIDEPITLPHLARHVGLSLSGLKRLFLDATGQSAGQFIRRLRMEGAFRSLQNKTESVLEIALAHGFEDHSAFARSFKKSFGYSPTHAREKINIIHELEHVTLQEPELVHLDAFPIQAVTKQGLYFECAPAAWQELKTLLPHGVLEDDFTGSFVCIGHDNPHEGHTPPDQVRFSAGVTHVDQDLAGTCIMMASGLYARFSYEGKLNNLGMAYHYIYGAWARQKGVVIQKDQPTFVVMDRFPDPFQEHSLCLYTPLLEPIHSSKT